jgi:hypothetical protein
MDGIRLGILITLISFSAIFISGVISYYRKFRAIERQQAADFAKINKAVTEAFNNADLTDVIDRYLEMMPSLYAAEREGNKLHTEDECFKRTTTSRTPPILTTTDVQRIMDRVYGDGSSTNPNVRHPVIGGMGEVDVEVNLPFSGYKPMTYQARKKIQQPDCKIYPNDADWPPEEIEAFKKSFLDATKKPFTFLDVNYTAHYPNYFMHITGDDKCACSTCVIKRSEHTHVPKVTNCKCPSCVEMRKRVPLSSDAESSMEDEECELGIDCVCDNCTVRDEEE